MPRSTVRTGRIDARDRATQRRRRHRKRDAEARDDIPALGRWLDSLRDTPIENLAKLDLTDYLRATEHLEIEAAERLRQLAIVVERARSSSPSTTWEACDRVYREALRLAPDDPWVHESRGITARALAEEAERDDDLARHLFGWARSALARARELAPTEPHIVYSHAMALYVDPSESTDRAREGFEEVLRLEPGHPWALLYRAHCLHDARRWAEAAEAYGLVPEHAFGGDPHWRMDLLAEQRALCLLRAGNRSRAAAEVDRFITRLQAAPGRAATQPLPHLDELATAFPDRAAALRALSHVAPL